MRPLSLWVGTLGLLVGLIGACDGDDKDTDPADTPAETDESPVDTDDTVDPDTPDDSDTVQPDTPDESDTPVDSDDTPLDTDTPGGGGDTAETAAVDSGTPGDTGVLPPPDPPDSGEPVDTSGGGGGDPEDPCGPVDVEDCNGDCANPLLLQDDVCHDGRAPGMPDFDCEAFNFDEGACVDDTDTQPCPDPLDVRDCDGRCYPETWVGDGQCDDGTVYPHGNPNFLCQEFDDDEGDCNPLAP